MQFDGPFGSAEMSPIKQANRQINNGGIQADQFILEAELFLADSLVLKALEEQEKEFLIKLAGSVFVGIG